MKFSYLIFALLLVGCGNKKHAKQSTAAVLTDSVKRSTEEQVQQPVASKPPLDDVIENGVKMPAADLYSYLERHQWDTAFEKVLQLDVDTDEQQQGPGAFITTTVLKNDAFQIVCVAQQTASFDFSGKISINGQQIKQYIYEEEDSPDIDALSIQSVCTFKSAKYHYLLITATSVGAVGKFGHTLTGLLVNMDQKPYAARVLLTHMEPGCFYFTPSGNTGKLKYITVSPLESENDEGELPENISVQVSELHEP